MNELLEDSLFWEEYDDAMYWSDWGFVQSDLIYDEDEE